MDNTVNLDFETSADGITRFVGSVNPIISGGCLELGGGDSLNAYTIPTDQTQYDYQIGRWYEVIIDVKSNPSSEWVIQDHWGTQNGHQTEISMVIRGTGVQCFVYRNFGRPVIFSRNSQDNIQIESITVRSASCTTAFQSDLSLGGGFASGINSISIGSGSEAQSSRSVVIGENSSDEVNDSCDPTATSGAMVAIGWLSKVFSWRGVAIGEKTVAAATSSTAVGSNAVAGKSHDVALGRGAYAPPLKVLDEFKIEDEPRIVLGGAQNNKDIHVYFSNTWANIHHLPISGVEIGSTPTPSDFRVVMHGWDALDVSENPTQGATSGGHVQLSGGASTGLADGGSVEFATTPGTQFDENCKNARVVAGKFDADKTADTRFSLLDNRTGEMRRVEILQIKGCCGLKKDVLCLSGPSQDI